jgi:hypothetical protein
MESDKIHYEETKIEGIFRTTFCIEHCYECFISNQGRVIRKLEDLDWKEFAKFIIENEQFNNYEDNEDPIIFLFDENYMMIRDYFDIPIDKRIHYNAYDIRTPKQIEYLNKHNVIVDEFGILIKVNHLTKEQHKKIGERLARERKEKEEYYSHWENQFHCPSGFPRQDYIRWKGGLI